MNSHQHPGSCCQCPHHRTPIAKEPPAIDPFAVKRRDFLTGMGALTVGGFMLAAAKSAGAAEYAPQRRPIIRQSLKVQPVLTYEIPHRREATSWRSWGGIQKEEDALAEKSWITGELEKLKQQADFPLEFLPVALVKTGQEAAAAAKGDFDVMLIYGAGGGGDLLETLTVPGKANLMFLRHSPGPAYLWYEIVSPRFLRKTVDAYGQPGWTPQDVVVDEHAEILWRLRALGGLKNTLGKRMVCIGGAAGWGEGGQQAPAIAKNLWKMTLVDYPYQELAPRITAARANAALVSACNDKAAGFLKESGISLHTTRQFVHNAFVLTEVFQDVMDELKTDAMTINSCMGTIMPMSETTACLPLSLLNDAGYQAYCESDFVVIPSGVLLHSISGLPVFLNDPTYPHANVVTLAHCTAPRKMDGKSCEPAKILTHFESDYGAAPKVEMKLGQVCTNLVPDFASKRWLGFAGTIMANPFLEICRSQIDVRIDGDSELLMEQMKGFHWMMSYGDYLRECNYALRKVGVGFLNLSAKKPV
ncbi:MAG: sugar isomerase [Verrucomicrobia bacterium]|nr:sugar isomerase [Verrucomicrobiota bacterium]